MPQLQLPELDQHAAVLSVIAADVAQLQSREHHTQRSQELRLELVSKQTGRAKFGKLGHTSP
mgnify:CR=1 FL=1